MGTHFPPSVMYYKTSHLGLLPVGGQCGACSCIYKPKPNFQIPYLHSEHGYRPGSPSPDQLCKSQDAANRSSCFLPFLLCQIHAKLPCVWSSKHFILQIQTKITLPDIPSRLMIRLSNGLGEPRSARRLSRGMDIAVRS